MADISRRSVMGWLGALLLPWAPKKSHAVEVIRSGVEIVSCGVNRFPGGITWVDLDYEEGVGARLIPLAERPWAELASFVRIQDSWIGYIKDGRIIGWGLNNG